jgi:hypothetical protein
MRPGAIDIAFMFVERINRGDLEGLIELMAADHTFVDLAGDVEEGRDSMRNGWASYFSAFPEYMIPVSELYRVEDAVLLVGRTTGSHLRLPRQVEFQESLIRASRIVDDLVAEWRIYHGTDDVRRALGVGAHTKVA